MFNYEFMTHDFVILKIPFQKYSTLKNARQLGTFETMYSLWI